MHNSNPRRLTEGTPKFWLSVVTELKNRGAQDVLIACVDGLKGFPEAIEAIFPRVQVQLCIVHLLRNSLGYVSWKERKALAAALKPIYTAATAEQAEQELTEFEERWGARYPMIGRSWRANSRARDSVLPVPGRDSEGDLYDQRSGVTQLQPAENHQKPEPVPER